ncbi:MAG: DNA repair protein RecO [Gemmatimonadetes bacterium]|nr:DNA repair protein RecO [Gemmatimonadota bacterium]
MSHLDSEAFVLRHVRQGETSHVVTLFARSGGKVAVLAKGSRKPGSRFGAGLDLFNLTRIRYRPRPNRDLVFLDACELARDFGCLARDVFGYAAAAVCAELVDRVVPEGADSDEIFELLHAAFDALATTVPLPPGEEMRAVALCVAFQMKLADCLGIAPELTACVACGEADLSGAGALSPGRGGLLCRRCRAAEGGRRLGAETIGFLRESLFGELSAPLLAPRAPARGLLLEARSALDSLFEYHHHGHPGQLRARRFLDELWR